MCLEKFLINTNKAYYESAYGLNANTLLSGIAYSQYFSNGAAPSTGQTGIEMIITAQGYDGGRIQMSVIMSGSSMGRIYARRFLDSVWSDWNWINQ